VQHQPDSVLPPCGWDGRALLPHSCRPAPSSRLCQGLQWITAIEATDRKQTPTAVEFRQANAIGPRRGRGNKRKTRHLQAFRLSISLISSGGQASNCCFGGQNGARNVQKWKAGNFGLQREKNSLAHKIQVKNHQAHSSNEIHGFEAKILTGDWPTCWHPRGPIDFTRIR